MTYRVGDHSTSDNSSLYRKEEEKKYWIEVNNPIKRLIKFLKGVGYNKMPN
jgi:2-oxoisovalerate dehydrogenase E1 component alpha subunit